MRLVVAMCRMFGVVAEAPVALRALLADAPRSLAVLSREHRDGWGIASTADGDWSVRKGTDCAHDSSGFRAAADTTSATIAIAHVRQKTVGPTSLSNTHPFVRGRWVLAHNGTVEDVPRLASLCSRARLAEIEGDTDSERLFAFLMTSIDDAGDVQVGLASAVRRLHALPGVGAVNFLLSEGRRLYAHRLGRTLFVLERTAGSGTRTPSITVASERLTDEPWVEVSQGTLLVVDARRALSMSLVA